MLHASQKLATERTRAVSSTTPQSTIEWCWSALPTVWQQERAPRSLCKCCALVRHMLVWNAGGATTANQTTNRRSGTACMRTWKMIDSSVWIVYVNERYENSRAVCLVVFHHHPLPRVDDDGIGGSVGFHNKPRQHRTVDLNGVKAMESIYRKMKFNSPPLHHFESSFQTF